MEEIRVKDKIFKYESIVVQQYSSSNTYFMPNSDPKQSIEYTYPSAYLVPFQWRFWGVPEGDEDVYFEAIDEADYSNCIKIGELSAYLILCRLMKKDGLNPLMVCDDESADLEYVMSALTSKNGPFYKQGNSFTDILYINEFNIEDIPRKQGLDARVLMQLSELCKELMHVYPEMLTFMETSPPDPKESEFYLKNGFQKFGTTQLLYLLKR